MSSSCVIRSHLVCPVCKRSVEQRQVGLFRATKYYCQTCDTDYDKGDVIQATTCRCLNCGEEYDAIPTEKNAQCPSCHSEWKTEFPDVCVYLTPAPTPERDEMIIWESPVRKFSADVAIVPPAGVVAVVVQGTKAWPVPAFKAHPFSDQNPNKIVQATVYFVRQELNHQFLCGTQIPQRIFAHVRDSKKAQQGEVRCGAKIRIAVNEESADLFVRKAGYQSRSLKDLIGGTDTFQGLSKLLLECFGGCLEKAAQAVVDSKGIMPEETKLYMTEISDNIADNISEIIKDNGLLVESCNLESYEVALIAQELNMEQRLAQRVSRNVTWESRPIRVNEPNQKDLFAYIVLGGKAQLRLKDTEKLLDTPEGKRWGKASEAEDVAEKVLSEEIGDNVYAIFQEILQSMIDEVECSIQDIPRFVLSLQRSVLDYLNTQTPFLSARGIEIQNITVEIKKQQLSEALEESGSVERTIAQEEVKERFRKYSDRLKLTRATDASGIRIQLGEIEADEATKMLDIERRKKHVAAAEAKDDADLEIETMTQEERVRQEEEKRDFESAMKDMSYRHEIEGQRSRYQEQEEEARKAQARKNELQDYDHAYEVWQKQKRIAEDKRHTQGMAIEEEIRSDIRNKRLVSEADREETLAGARMKQTLEEIIRAISESNLTFRQKLEGYEHLREITDAQDMISLEEKRERASISLDDLRAKGLLSISKESAEIADTLAEHLQQRKEREMQIEYAQYLENKRMDLAHQIEKIRLENENKKLWVEARTRQQELSREMDQLTRMLSHAETMDRQSMIRDITALKADVKAAHERNELIRDHSEKEMENQKAFSSEKDQMRERETERIERLYTQLLNLEHQRSEIKEKQPEIFRILLQEPAETKADSMPEKEIEKLFDYLKKMQEELHSLHQKVEEQAEKQDAKSQHATFTCSKCGYPLPNRYVRMCPKCHSFLD